MGWEWYDTEQWMAHMASMPSTTACVREEELNGKILITTRYLRGGGRIWQSGRQMRAHISGAVADNNVRGSRIKGIMSLFSSGSSAAYAKWH